MYIINNYPKTYIRLPQPKPPQAKMQQVNSDNCLPNAISYPISFGTFFQTNVRTNPPEGNILKATVHETHFFRDKETLGAVAEYIKKNFPNGTNIADFGCSKGEEAFTLAMFLDKANHKTPDGKHLYNITGYDIDEDIVKSAQNRIFVIYDHKVSEDSFLLKNKNEHKSEELPYLRMFHKYFEGINKPSDPVIVEFIRDMAYEKKGTRHEYSFYKVKDDALQYVDFKMGNINDLDTMNLDNTGVIIFKNAWYHLTGNHTGFRKYEVTPKNLDREISKIRGKYDDVAKKINKKLPINGILVTGSFEQDHVAVIRNNKHKDIFLEGRPILDQVLLANGFVPIKKKYVKLTRRADHLPDKQILLPTIWKKVSNV